MPSGPGGSGRRSSEPRSPPERPIRVEAGRPSTERSRSESTSAGRGRETGSRSPTSPSMTWQRRSRRCARSAARWSIPVSAGRSAATRRGPRSASPLRSSGGESNRWVSAGPPDTGRLGGELDARLGAADDAGNDLEQAPLRAPRNVLLEADATDVRSARAAADSVLVRGEGAGETDRREGRVVRLPADRTCENAGDIGIVNR